MPISSEDSANSNDSSIRPDEAYFAKTLVDNPPYSLNNFTVNYGLGAFGENINCILIGFKEEYFIESFKTLFKKHVASVSVMDIASATTVRFGDTRRLPDLILIDLDNLDRATSLDDLIHLRNGLHRMPLIIGSRYFIDDDLSTERSAVADASIVLPTTVYSFKRALMAAVENNKRFLESYVKVTVH